MASLLTCSSSAAALLLRNVARTALGAPATQRLMSSASTNKAQEEELPQPSYVYQSPGSSIREPGLGTGHSLSNPTYEYDPKPSSFGTSSPTPTNTATQSTAARQQWQRDQQAKQAAAARNLPGPSSIPPANLKAGSKKEEPLKGASVQEPTYVYQPPGSSLKDASYGFSVRDPVYQIYPPAPETSDNTPAYAAPSSSSSSSSPSSSASAGTKQQPVMSAPSKSSTGLRPDDYANQAYVTSPKGSMREPHYVSVSDPLDRK